MMAAARRQNGVLGGTFDPVHLAHLRLAEEAADQLALDRVLFVPAPNPWRKAGRTIAPVEHRLEMVRLAVPGGSGRKTERLGTGSAAAPAVVEMMRAIGVV